VEGAWLRSQKTVLDAARVREMIGRLSAPERKQAIHGLRLLSIAADRMMQERPTQTKAGFTPRNGF
jgi:hypothetical protein